MDPGFLLPILSRVVGLVLASPLPSPTGSPPTPTGAGTGAVTAAPPPPFSSQALAAPRQTIPDVLNGETFLLIVSSDPYRRRQDGWQALREQGHAWYQWSARKQLLPRQRGW
eukprot:2920047-Pleurochrysis_carterae.AAC.1